MSDNKYFSNAERPYTALFDLLPRLTKGKRADHQLGYGYTCETDMLKAAASHTDNSVKALTTCMQSLGTVVHQAATTGELDAGDMANMGWLMRELTNLIEACDFLRGEAEFELAERGERNI